MYKLSMNKGNVNTHRPHIELRTRPKVKMKFDFTDKERVWRSPFYVCNRLWDKLDCDIQTAKTMWEFVEKVKRIDNLEGL